MMPDSETIQRVNSIRPAALANDVLAATHALGGEAPRVAIIDRAVEIGGWSDNERAVRSRISGAARTVHLRTCADYAITTCSERGHLESVNNGVWRLATPPKPEGHPFDRVFTVGVGVGGEPVTDDWSAADQHHLWFSKMSRQIGRGDHIFALGAGRQSAVLGLYEVTSPGVGTAPPNPWDADRWPYVAAVRPLASVPPRNAVGVDGVIAPRGAPPLIRGAERIAALYAAVEGYALAVSRADGEARPAGRSTAYKGFSERTPRPFDPERRPTPATIKDGNALQDCGETLQLQEKARQGHHRLMVNLHAALGVAGWTGLEEIERAIDLRGRRDSVTVIFEAKTIAGDNETSQCRSALAQLLEYRLDYGSPDDELCIVVDQSISERRLELLTRLGVAVAQVVADGSLNSLNQPARAQFG
jgi:hypothetical protein